MKKIYLYLYITFFIVSINNSIAQCPLNRINCKTPCGKFIDNNNDGYCDNTIITKKNTLQDTVKQTTDTTKVRYRNTVITKKKTMHKNKTSYVKKSEKKILVNTVKPKQCAPDTGTSIDSLPTAYNPDISPAPFTEQKDNNKTVHDKYYNLLLISIITIILYTLTFILSRIKVIKTVTHRKMWNMTLLIVGLVSILFGFFLVIQRNYDFMISWYGTIIYWHVQAGIAMSIISIFHISWHWRYFKNYFRNSEKFKN